MVLKEENYTICRIKSDGIIQSKLPLPRTGVPWVSMHARLVVFIVRLEDSVPLINAEIHMLTNGSCVTRRILLPEVNERKRLNRFFGSESGVRNSDSSNGMLGKNGTISCAVCFALTSGLVIM